MLEEERGVILNLHVIHLVGDEGSGHHLADAASDENARHQRREDLLREATRVPREPRAADGRRENHERRAPRADSGVEREEVLALEHPASTEPSGEYFHPSHRGARDPQHQQRGPGDERERHVTDTLRE